MLEGFAYWPTEWPMRKPSLCLTTTWALFPTRGENCEHEADDCGAESLVGEGDQAQNDKEENHEEVPSVRVDVTQGVGLSLTLCRVSGSGGTNGPVP